MAWRNPRWNSLKGTDAEDLRAIFESLQVFLDDPTFDKGVNLGIAGGTTPTVNGAGVIVRAPLPLVGNDNLDEMLADGSITTNLLADLAVTNAKLVDNAVTAVKVATSAITTTKIADGSITTAKVVAGAITANEIAANTITAAKIAAGTITATEIAANTITAAKIAASTITGAEIAATVLGVGKYIRSQGYVAGSSGWAIDASGTAEFSNVTIRGTLATNTVSGWLTTGAGGGFRTGSSGVRVEISSFVSSAVNFYTGAADEVQQAQVFVNNYTTPSVPSPFQQISLSSGKKTGHYDSSLHITSQTLAGGGGTISALTDNFLLRDPTGTVAAAYASLWSNLVDIGAVGGLTRFTGSISGDAAAVTSAWTSPTLTSSWVNYDASTFYGAGYMKDALGFVHLRGLIKNGSGVAFVLPAGYRPALRCIFAVDTDTSVGRLDVDTAGNVYPFRGGNGYFCLDGISFPTI